MTMNTFGINNLPDMTDAYKLVQEKAKKDYKNFTSLGQEVAFGTIGNASTSEGVFWEVMNASAVLELPVLMSIWDDDYGISVDNSYQTTKSSISESIFVFNSSK
mgnify:CR=1 FL=1